MSSNRHFDKICVVVLCFALAVTVLFMNGNIFGIACGEKPFGYVSKLFDDSKVHTLDIVMDDWETFIKNCADEEYRMCTVIIDGEANRNVGIRAKGNTSLTQVESYGNDRYSFKIEFDHYDSSSSYYGLDKLCLNNIIQDNTYMKDYLSYKMMAEIGAVSPLCSYVYITVNGEEWGLYLAVEGVEESFLQRNYGNDYGELYKPDSQSLGGGRGNGENFDADKFFREYSEIPEDIKNENGKTTEDGGENNKQADTEFSDGGLHVRPGGDGQIPEFPQNGQPPDRGGRGDNFPPDISSPDGKTDNVPGGRIPDRDMGGVSGDSGDVLLKYLGDEIESYSNIFSNAKIDVSDSDKKRLISSLKNLNYGESLSDTVDIDGVIRYFAVHNFVLNFDSYTGSMIHNYYLYEKDGQMQMIPWDYNLAFGGFNASDDASALVNYPIDSPVSGGDTEDRPMLAWIFADEEYTELYHRYLSEFISDYFDSGKFSETIASVRNMISPYVEKDPTKFCSYDEFLTGVGAIEEFCLLRAESVSLQLSGEIPSTADGQSENSGNFVDAYSVDVSSMGNMNGHGFGNKENFRPDSGKQGFK